MLIFKFLKKWTTHTPSYFFLLLLKTIPASPGEQITHDETTTSHFDTITYLVKHRKDEVKDVIKYFPHSYVRDKWEFYSSLDDEVIDTIQDSLKEEDEESNIWQNYVIRKSSWKGLYRNADQKKYGNMMNASVRAASRCIKEKGWDFTTLLRFLSIRRGDIAVMQGMQGFGYFRTTLYKTNCASTYLPLANRLWEICKKIQQDQFPSEKLVRLLPSEEDTIGSIETSEKEAISNKWQFFEKIGNEKQIALSIVDFRDSTPEDMKNTIIIHTHPEEIPKIMQYLSCLYEEAMKQNDTEKLTEKLGEIFWWICQAKPWNRGDPSIAEMLIKTIMTVKGEPIRPWKEDLIPWVEVMVQPDVKIFSREFSSLFE